MRKEIEGIVNLEQMHEQVKQIKLRAELQGKTLAQIGVPMEWFFQLAGVVNNLVEAYNEGVKDDLGSGGSDDNGRSTVAGDHVDAGDASGGSEATDERSDSGA